MTDAMDEKLYGLIEIAERQQAVVQTVLEQLTDERLAFARERGEWVNAMDLLSGDVSATVSKTVSQSMAGLADVGAEAIRRLNEPLATLTTQVSADAAEARTALRALVEWATWRVLAWGLGSLAGLVVLGWLMSGAVLWWDTRAIGAAQVAKVQLQAEVAQLRATREAWAQAGMLARLERCGPKKRLCIRVDENAGAFGELSDYRIVNGY